MLEGQRQDRDRVRNRRRTFVVAALAVASGLALVVSTAVWAGSAGQDDIVRGTKKADVLTGTAGRDRILGLAGDDWLRGLAGDDVLDGGNGRDRLSGGPGNDRILARDGARDRIYCGLGRDTVVADALDRAHGDCETVLRPSKPAPVPESRADCATTNYESWTWEECKPGTKILLTNEGWHCRMPLSSYGELPIKVVILSTEAWRDSAAVTVNTGCTGARGTDVNLIVDIRGEGPKSASGPGYDAFKTRVNPKNLRITGSLQCGRLERNGHQDALQIQGGTDIAFVNVETGNYGAGLSTCSGAGGGPFYSLNQISNVDVWGGNWISCNHSLNGSHPGAGNDIINASFRSGRNDRSDPSCDFHSSKPCVRTASLTLRNVKCEQWVEGRWVAMPPR